MKKYLLFLPYFAFSLCYSQTTIINAGATWKYLDDGSNLVNDWVNSNYNDASWSSGSSELGYGDGDESTVVGYGASSSSKYITTYFRKNFVINNVSQFTQLNLELIRDDGAVVYINGIEVLRSNIPQGTVNYLTLANNTVSWPNEDDWQNFTISPLVLQNGNNTIAVEIHQDSPSSSDISFNLKLVGTTQPIISTINRGPYLNLSTSNSIIVKWRTDIATDSKVEFGSTLGNLNQIAFNTDVSTNHEVKINNLSPSNKYYYRVGNSSGMITLSSNDIYFKTSPITGSNEEYRFWVIGDAGTGNDNQRSVREAFMNYNNGRHIDGWIWLGDNAYEGGFDSEYQSNVFSNNTYENELKKIVVWPAVGNHDYNNNIPFSPSPAYFDIFSLPANAEAGGVPSGTEKYYSYNYGNIHFIVLDSFDESRSSNGAMAQWLQADLAANNSTWIIAYWHHPPYTKGSHDSDNSFFIDWELPQMRENIVPILEAGGVDLVLCGHSHSYERSFLIDSHYGNSGSLTPSMILDDSGGNFPVVCPYQKNTLLSNAHKGTIYAVVGCSGKLSGTSINWPHPIMHKATNLELGSMLLSIKSNRLDGKFIKNDASVTDSFTIVKNAGKKFDINFCLGDSVVLKPSWHHKVNWLPVNISSADSIIIYPASNITYYAVDPLSCITDTFNLILNNDPPCLAVNSNELRLDTFTLYPVPIYKNENSYLKIIMNKEEKSELVLKDLSGKIILKKSLLNKTSEIDVSDFPEGFLIMEMKTPTKLFVKKILIF